MLTLHRLTIVFLCHESVVFKQACTTLAAPSAQGICPLLAEALIFISPVALSGIPRAGGSISS